MTWLLTLFALVRSVLRFLAPAVPRRAESACACANACVDGETPRRVSAGVMRPNDLVARIDTRCEHVAPAVGRSLTPLRVCDADAYGTAKRRPSPSIVAPMAASGADFGPKRAAPLFDTPPR